MTALTASIRHKARSIAEVVREHMSQRSYMLFLIFIWIALVYIIVAFTDITASRVRRRARSTCAWAKRRRRSERRDARKRSAKRAA